MGKESGVQEGAGRYGLDAADPDVAETGEGKGACLRERLLRKAGEKATIWQGGEGELRIKRRENRCCESS